MDPARVSLHRGWRAKVNDPVLLMQLMPDETEQAADVQSHAHVRTLCKAHRFGRYISSVCMVNLPEPVPRAALDRAAIV